jgi:hypothetical protein
MSATRRRDWKVSQGAIGRCCELDVRRRGLAYAAQLPFLIAFVEAKNRDERLLGLAALALQDHIKRRVG